MDSVDDMDEVGHAPFRAPFRSFALSGKEPSQEAGLAAEGKGEPLDFSGFNVLTERRMQLDSCALFEGGGSVRQRRPARVSPCRIVGTGGVERDLEFVRLSVLHGEERQQIACFAIFPDVQSRPVDGQLTSGRRRGRSLRAGDLLSAPRPRGCVLKKV